MITSQQVRNIIGHSRISDHAISQIVAVGASEKELLEAHSRVVRGDIVGAEVQHGPGATVSRLCEILSADENVFPGEADY